MDIVKIKAHIGKDGILRLDIPVSVSDVDCDVIVTTSAPMTPEEWNLFIDKTAGSLADDPIERPSQGSYEQRDPIP
jgi:hypothetical protein